MYYVTMGITLPIPEFTRNERNFHCDYHRQSRQTRSGCRDRSDPDVAIKVYRKYRGLKDMQSRHRKHESSIAAAYRGIEENNVWTMHAIHSRQLEGHANIPYLEVQRSSCVTQETGSVPCVVPSRRPRGWLELVIHSRALSSENIFLYAEYNTPLSNYLFRTSTLYAHLNNLPCNTKLMKSRYKDN